MDTVLVITILVVVFALAFDFVNGFHDTANAIATAVSTRALSPRAAIVMAAGANLIGALTFTGVAKGISKDIVNPFDLGEGTTGAVVILSALIAGLTWNLLTWYFGIPSSSSHTIIGAIAGAAISASGFGVLNYSGFTKILIALIVSPILAITIGFIVMKIFFVLFRNTNLTRSTRNFRTMQIFTAFLQAFTHGTNDAQKAMGIITMALIAGNFQADDEVHMWVRFACATAMAGGTAIGGWKIIKTVGSKIMKIRPVNGAAADLTSATIIFGATLIHLPVSTTHVISSAIMGVGAGQRLKSVKWGNAQRIVMTWIVTIPISALFAGLIYQVLNLFF